MNLQLLAGAGVLALIVGFGGGWATRDAFCDAARLAKENAELRTQIETWSRSAELNAALQTELDEEREKTDELRRAYEATVAADDCLSTDRDADALNRILRGRG